MQNLLRFCVGQQCAQISHLPVKGHGIDQNALFPIESELNDTEGREERALPYHFGIDRYLARRLCRLYLFT